MAHCGGERDVFLVGLRCEGVEPAQQLVGRREEQDEGRRADSDTWRPTAGPVSLPLLSLLSGRKCPLRLKRCPALCRVRCGSGGLSFRPQQLVRKGPICASQAPSSLISRHVNLLDLVPSVNLLIGTATSGGRGHRDLLSWRPDRAQAPPAAARVRPRNRTGCRAGCEHAA
jgi:hypothetical protein